MTAVPIYVIDTSYLCELFRVPGFSTPKSIDEVERRFRLAVAVGARFYVSVPAICELAGHIADLADGRLRRKLSVRLRDTVVDSIDEGRPWNLLGMGDTRAMEKHMDGFVRHSSEGLSLVDAVLIDEANRLRRETYRGRAWRVHIWTKDRSLKAREPDREPRPFLG